MRYKFAMHLFRLKVALEINRIKVAFFICLGWIACLFLAFNVAKNALWEYLDGNELYHAARASDWVKATKLMQDGCNVNSQDDRGKTTLMWTVGNAPPSIVEEMLKRGADPFAREFTQGATVLNFAGYRRESLGKKQIVDLIKQFQSKSQNAIH